MEQDLMYLNRDLSKVILLDVHPEHASAQPENTIIMPKWDGKPGDKSLIAMIPFLECTYTPPSSQCYYFRRYDAHCRHSDRSSPFPSLGLFTHFRVLTWLA